MVVLIVKSSPDRLGDYRADPRNSSEAEAVPRSSEAS